MIPHIRLFLYSLFWSEWQYVGLFELKVDFYYDAWRVYLHCYESRWGRRKVKLVAAKNKTSETITATWGLRRRVKNDKFYQTEMIPWLKGRKHDKIPAFEKVKSGKWDFTKKLKGQTPVVLNDDE